MPNEEKLYTKEEVVNLMKKRVERSHQAFFKRYGVTNLKELDEVFDLVVASKKRREQESNSPNEEYLHKLSCLDKVSKKLSEVLMILKKQACCKERHFSSFCFVGEDGVGKTIAALSFAELLFANGFINTRKPEIVCGDDLSSPKDIKDLYSRNENGLVVIEDASNMFGEGRGYERVSLRFALCEAMDTHRNDVFTVFIDKKSNMDVVLKGNRQFRSRVSQVVEFDNYSVDELMELALFAMKKESYTITNEAKNELLILIKYLTKQPTFANARTIKNVLEKLFLVQAKRTFSTDERDRLIILDDILVLERNEHLTRTILEDGKKTFETRLNELVGLTNVKKQIERIKAYTLKNLKNLNNLNLHMCFVGNPGTGKTEVAKLLAGILYENGVFPENKIVIKDRSQLVGEYIGQTAPRVRAAVMESIGGVLFIDEAYMLDPRESEKDYGHEAIAELLNCMEEYRGQFVCIFAGYKNETIKMIESNPGLKSRISRFIDFDNYTKQELLQIAKLMISRSDYKCSNTTINMIVDIADSKRENGNFANAREIRNILESLYEIQSVRTLDKKSFVITKEDVEEYIKDNKINLNNNIVSEIDESIDYLNNLPSCDLNEVISCKGIEDRTVLITTSKNGHKIGEGTGFIISDKGLIATNEHVIHEAEEITVRKSLFLTNSCKVFKEYKAKLFKSSKNQDVALISIVDKDQTFPYFNLFANKINELSSVMMGGYPFGGSRLNNISFTEGRVISYNSDSMIKDEDKIERIYVDLKGVPGNSGSAVIDKTTGQVVGIFSGASVNWQNSFPNELNYAIPVKYVLALLHQRNTQIVE